jgi:negative regulator of sigma E activity
MNEASRLLDGELTDAELTTVLERLRHDAALRDEVTAQQLIRDGLGGLRSLDAGYSLRIVARLHQARKAEG